jgi:hypothetical protein
MNSIMMLDNKGVNEIIADIILKIGAASLETENFGDSINIFSCSSFSISSRSVAVIPRIRRFMKREKRNE